MRVGSFDPLSDISYKEVEQSNLELVVKEVVVKLLEAASSQLINQIKIDNFCMIPVINSICHKRPGQ